MSCPAKKRSGEVCGKKPFCHGVCKIHQQYAFDFSEVQDFEADFFLRYTEAYLAYHKKAEECEKKGKSVLGVQGLYGNNLCSKPVLRKGQDKDYIEVADRLERLISLSEYGKTLYDPYLVYTTTVRINHGFGLKCDCHYCCLGEM